MIEAVCFFSQDSGPLVLLPREALPFWEGNDPPSSGRVVDAISRWDDQETATDYDRACDVIAWAEVLPVGPDSWGLVLPEDAGGIAWLSPDDRPGTFALVQCLILDAEALSSYDRLFSQAMEDESGWTTLQENLTVGGNGLLLMPAASRSDETREIAWGRAAQIGTAQAVPLPEGLYSVDQFVVPGSEDEAAGVIFTRFRQSVP
ncbi:MAG: Imm21 family immunity protein [Armatimonadota bacterium]